MKDEHEQRADALGSSASTRRAGSGGASAGEKGSASTSKSKRKASQLKPMPSVKSEVAMERTSAATHALKKKKSEGIRSADPSSSGSARGGVKKIMSDGEARREGQKVTGKTLKEIIRSNLKIEREEQNRERREKNAKQSAANNAPETTAEAAKMTKENSARAGDGNEEEEENEEEDDDGAARGDDALTRDGTVGGGGGGGGVEEVAAPQVEVVDGQIVINEQSLEVPRADDKEFEEKRKVVNEGAGGLGAKLNAGSYTNKSRTPRWSDDDTELFYKVCSTQVYTNTIAVVMYADASRALSLSISTRVCVCWMLTLMLLWSFFFFFHG